MLFENGCVFCDEVASKRQASIVYEDDSVMAFMDIFPVERGHTLVIPKDHYVNVFDIDPESFRRTQEVARVMAKAVMESMGADGINVGQNNGPCANQRVMHYHIHVIPRWCDRHLNWERKEADGHELESVASSIKDVFDSYLAELNL